MPKRFIAIAALVALVVSTQKVLPSRAAGWGELDSNTGESLLSIDGHGDAVFAVGTDGQIVYSSDQGQNWSSGDSNTDAALFAVSAISAEKAVAVGENTLILRSTDGGEDWTEINPDLTTTAHTNLDLYAVAMASSSVGYATGEGGLVLKTTDGGASWDEGESPTTNYDFNSIATYGTSMLWLAGETGRMYKSIDGGDSWIAQSSGTASHLLAVDFVDSSDGFAVGEDSVFLRTSNGGGSWSEVTVSEINDDETITDVDFLNEDDGLLSLASGEVWETSDGGDSWDEVDVSVSSAMNDLYYVSSSVRFAVGDDGVIVRYDDSSPDAPEDFDVSGTNSAITDTTPSFYWSASEDDDTSIAYYEFKMDSGSYKNVGNVTSKTYSTTLSNGSHTAYLRAVDTAGNTSTAVSVSFTVDADSTSSSAPDIGKISPTKALSDETVTFSAMINDDDGSMDECHLYVDGDEEKSMSIKTDVTYTTYEFTSTGSHSLYARCTNDDGETASGTSVTVTVISQSNYADPGDIIKMACSGDVYVNDPCTAVYYYGYDGRRHAFPNESVFKSWFDDFDDLVVMTSAAMEDLSLGENVTYKPGEQLVQFSGNTVYAVSYAGILRPIASGDIAKALFGSDWTTEIYGVSDAFYSNYRIGSMIESSADYSASDVKSASRTIDSTF